MLNQEAVGKQYVGERFVVTQAASRAYAEATGALARWEQVWREGSGGVTAPLFAVRPLVGVLFAAIQDEEVGIDLKRLVHGEQHMTFHDVLREGDVLESGSQVMRIVTRSSGEVLSLRQWLERDGELVVEAVSELFVRGTLTSSGQKKPEPEEQGECVYEHEQVIESDQSVRYAHASGDMNPLHTSDEFARKAGLPGKILHGLCTMAIGVGAVIDGLCEGEVSRLERVSVRFSRPVYMGDVLTTRVYEGEEGVHGFEVINARGDRVLTMGEVRIRAL